MELSLARAALETWNLFSFRLQRVSERRGHVAKKRVHLKLPIIVWTVPWGLEVVMEDLRAIIGFWVSTRLCA